jgi:hypothetical protein
LVVQVLSGKMVQIDIRHIDTSTYRQMMKKGPRRPSPLGRGVKGGIHTSPTVQALQSSTVLKIIKLHYDLIMTPTYTSRVGYLCTSLSLSK